MKMTAWIEASAAACGVTPNQMRLWLYQGHLPLPPREVLGPRVIRVLAEPLTQLPETLRLKKGRRTNK